MLRAVAAVGVAFAAAAGATAARDAPALPGARATTVCAAAGPYWPTMTLAIHGTSAWIACKQQSRVVRVDTRTGKTLRSVRLDAPVIAVASGLSAVWALDSGGTLYRLNGASGRVVERTAVGATAAYNIWIGGGSVWVADDRGARVVRISPRTNEVVARVRVGNGPADMAFRGGTAWVISHRDRVLTRIELSTNTPQALGDVGGDAPERMAWARGSLWLTGRGTDLLRVDPADGSVEQTIEIGASGIDLAADGDHLWVPTRSAAIDRSGFPTLDSLKRVSAATNAVSVVARATARVDVHGFVAGGGVVWIADNTNGRLFRLVRGGGSQ